MHTTYDIRVDFLTAAAKQEARNRKKGQERRWASFLQVGQLHSHISHVLYEDSNRSRAAWPAVSLLSSTAPHDLVEASLQPMDSRL